MASYLQVENISKSYGPKVLFDNISFNINEGDKIALIAPNGTGKTSLLRILAGKDSSDHGGQIKYMKDIVTVFLEQDSICQPENTIFEEVLSQFTPRANDDILSAEIRAKQILTSLGLPDFDKQIKYLSGGETKRVDVARVLVQDADFIVMDEPTNHLDLEAIEYLEDYLKKSRRTLFMVTHDRYFLDRICNTILELDGGNIYTYKGNYSYYLEKRNERIANARAETDKYRNLFRRELEWMRSTPCARTGKARYRINAFYDLKDKTAGRPDDKQIKIDVETSRLGRKIINCKSVSFSYGDQCILNSFTYNFMPGEKIGIVGRNGIGKSTFVNLLTGMLTPTRGEIEIGDTVKFGYYQQSGYNFKEDYTVLETVREIAETATLADGSRVPTTTFLQHFLFPPSMFNAKISTLSGGEKRRLYLLIVLLRQPNVLILDEPTNDLDIVTLNVLEEYLKNFKGTVILVSHDRFFLDKLSDHLFVFMSEGHVKDFVGTYSEYRAYIKEYNRNIANEKKDSEKPKQKPQRQPSDKKKLSFKEQRELDLLEKDIETLSLEKIELEKDLSSGKLSVDDLNNKSKRIVEVIALLNTKEERWLELSE